MSPDVDDSRPVRPGEELDLERLTTYLRHALPDRDPDGRDELVVEQFPSGFSNLTYLLRFGGEELVLRRPPFGNRVATAHDMEREHRVLSRLHPCYPLAPRPLLFCADAEVVGAPFFVMERRRGVILHRQAAAEAELTPATAQRLSEALIDHLAALHRLPLTPELAELGRPDGYVRRQVEGWAGRYRRARTHDWRQLEAVMAHLESTLPQRSLAAVVHNDYKLDNLVLDPRELSRITAVLDWEMATVGDPLLDLGTSLAYWVEAGDGDILATGVLPPPFPGSLSRRQMAERYAAQSGLELGDLTFELAFGLFKIAVIAQQIYARFARGLTQDRRFAHLDQVVALLGQRAAAVLDRGSF